MSQVSPIGPSRQWSEDRSGLRIAPGAPDSCRVERLLREFGSQLAVSLDVRADRLVTDGWTVDTGEGLSDAARRLVNAGVSRLIHTEVKRDGILAGPGLAGLKQLTSLGVPVMVAGGVSSYQDLKELRAAGAEAASAGRALLHGILTLPAAIVAAGGVAPASVGA